MKLFVFFIWCGLFFVETSAATDNNDICMYLDANQKIHQVKSLNAVPVKFRNSAKCISSINTNLASPKDIDLKGNIRTEEISSPLGKISLRWPRKVESLFGRTPVRATIDAANAVNRALSQSVFNSRTRDLNTKWEIVFMQENMPEKQIPSYLIRNCNPGWMTPPGNIYIVAERVAGGCGGQKPVRSSVADNELSQVLIHEMAHGIDAHLLGSAFSGDVARAEGFATWFTEYTSGKTTIINSKQIASEHTALAKVAVQQSPRDFSFDGSPYAYARASMYFKVLEKRLGLPAILEVYDYIRQTNSPIEKAIQHELGWNEERIDKEINALLRK